MSRRLALLVSSTLLATVLAVSTAGAAPFVPSETPDTGAEGTWNVAGTVFTSALSEDGETLYIGGKFTRVRENPPSTPCTASTCFSVTNLAAIDVDTGDAVRTWTPRVTATDGNAVVRSLEVDNDKVFVGGTFGTATGSGAYGTSQPRNNLAVIDAVNGEASDGSIDPFAPNVTRTNATPVVFALLAEGGKLYVGGHFNNVDGKARPNLAAFDYNYVAGTGTLDAAWKPKTNNKVRDLELAADGATIFASGFFSTATGSNGAKDSDGTAPNRESIARFQTSTGNLDPWKIRDGRIGTPQQCFELTATANRLYAGCGAGPNFAVAVPLNTTPGPDGVDSIQKFSTVGNVQAIELSPDGTYLFLGGHFGTNELEQPVCGGSRWLSGLVAVNPATMSPICTPPWTPQLAPSKSNGNGAWTLTMTDANNANKLWVGGGFTHVSSSGSTVNQPSLARFSYGSIL